MKDFIIVAPIMLATKQFIFNDLIDKSVYFNCKSVEKYNKKGYSCEFEVKMKDSDKVQNCNWISTFRKVKDLHLELKKDYNLDDYPKYIGTDIINVDNIREVPDYDGLMGGSLSFLSQQIPQFEVLGLVDNPTVIEDGKYVTKFVRVLIKKKQINNEQEAQT